MKSKGQKVVLTPAKYQDGGYCVKKLVNRTEPDIGAHVAKSAIEELIRDLEGWMGVRIEIVGRK